MLCSVQNVRNRRQTQNTSEEDAHDQKSAEEEVRSESFILRGVVTVTFGVLSLFVATKCYSCSETESVIINYSSAW
jgi:hypothetical protein